MYLLLQMPHECLITGAAEFKTVKVKDKDDMAMASLPVSSIPKEPEEPKVVMKPGYLPPNVKGAECSNKQCQKFGETVHVVRSCCRQPPSPPYLVSSSRGRRGSGIRKMLAVQKSCVLFSCLPKSALESWAQAGVSGKENCFVRTMKKHSKHFAFVSATSQRLDFLADTTASWLKTSDASAACVP